MYTYAHNLAEIHFEFTYVHIPAHKLMLLHIHIHNVYAQKCIPGVHAHLDQGGR